MLIRIFFILFISLLLNTTYAQNNIVKKEFMTEIDFLKENFHNIISFKMKK
jgi:hypothetical protein